MDYLIEQGVKVDLLCVDPDYPITARGSNGNSGGMFKKEHNMKGNVFGEKAPTISEWLPKAKQLLKDDAHIYNV